MDWFFNVFCGWEPSVIAFLQEFNNVKTLKELLNCIPMVSWRGNTWVRAQGKGINSYWERLCSPSLVKTYCRGPRIWLTCLKDTSYYGRAILWISSFAEGPDGSGFFLKNTTREKNTAANADQYSTMRWFSVYESSVRTRSLLHEISNKYTNQRPLRWTIERHYRDALWPNFWKALLIRYKHQVMAMTVD
jgi:hypothetical protein